MENNSIQQQNNFEEEEIDIMAIILRLWEKKWFIIKVTCVFAVLGVFVAIFSPKEYTASCVVVPETKGGGAFSSSSLGGLAAMAGINLGGSSGGEMISPVMYDKLMNNIDLRKELMQTPINWEGYEEPITILDYYTNPEYAKTSVLGTVKKYTIGLPFVILKAIRGEQEAKDVELPSQGPKLSAYTQDELKCIKAFSQQFSIMADKKNGDVTITARMPEALAAAQVAEAVKNLLQKYVIELKLQKAEVNYEYIKQRYDEAKVVFEEKQSEYAKFQDANKVLSTALSKAKEEQMRSEFTVAKNLFNELTTQLVQAEMKIKEDIPILTVVEPVQVPLEKSKPQRIKILFIWCFLGGVLGCGLILGYDWLKEKGVSNKLVEKIVG
ncbi:MAG: lipopolysaccharide biosynthesis protein [Bacteroidales bacterium]|nr:lipopolysaccharide biosynthesis protein [Bacteroidales bacterium]